MSIADQLFQWIGEEAPDPKTPNQPPMVPIHLLLVKQALAARGESADLTASTKLSLELFERAAVYRALRELYSQGLLEFVGTEGKPVVPSEKEISQAGAGERVAFQVVRLTKAGFEKARSRL